MTRDSAYCIRSNKCYIKPCTNTDCDRHMVNAGIGGEEFNIRVWAAFESCEKYQGGSHD